MNILKPRKPKLGHWGNSFPNKHMHMDLQLS